MNNEPRSRTCKDWKQGGSAPHGAFKSQSEKLPKLSSAPEGQGDGFSVAPEIKVGQSFFGHRQRWIFATPTEGRTGKSFLSSAKFWSSRFGKTQCGRIFARLNFRKHPMGSSWSSSDEVIPPPSDQRAPLLLPLLGALVGVGSRELLFGFPGEFESTCWVLLWLCWVGLSVCL